jgi:GT2 family glycosyltransferase
MRSPLPLSIVVPTHNAASTIAEVLLAILATDVPRQSFELIVVDDASADGSATIAARYADTVVRLSGAPCGAGYARNRGVELARGEVVAFVDADVLLRPDTLSRMLSKLSREPSLDAVSATHGDSPRVPGFVSRYWNLLLQFGEQNHAEGRAHFTSACGAVRRSVFLSSGMYDEWRHATGCLDGVELGQRLHATGHGMALSSELRISRLRQWNVRSLLTEVWRRSEFLARSLGYQRTRSEAPGEVVFTLSDALIPALAILCVVAVSAAFVTQPIWWAKVAIVLGIVVLTNLRVHRFFARSRGAGFAIAAAPLHLVAQAVSIMGLCVGWVLRDAVGDRVPDAKTQAYSEVGVEMWPPVPRRP